MSFLSRVSLLFLLSLTACVLQPKKYTAEEVEGESRRINEFFDRAFQENLDTSPMWKTYLGIKEQYAELDDLSDEKERKDHARLEKQMAELKTFSYDRLSP